MVVRKLRIWFVEGRAESRRPAGQVGREPTMTIVEEGDRSQKTNDRCSDRAIRWEVRDEKQVHTVVLRS